MKPIVLFLLLAAFSSEAQTVLRGRLTDSDHAPLPGVSVAVKGTKKGAVSDQQGNFLIEVASEDQIVAFHFLGYLSREIRASDWNGKGAIMMRPDTKTLDAVIIVCDNKKKPEEILNRVKVGPIPLYYEGQSRYYRHPFREKRIEISIIGDKSLKKIVY